MAFEFGVDVLLGDQALQSKLRDARIGLIAHPASVTRDGEHCFDALRNRTQLTITKTFGPQHGMRGEKQDNMVESQDYVDPGSGVPVLSLYGEHRRLTPAMMEDLDVLMVDLQDVGCRIYTFLTTLFYALEACSEHGKELWVLDRPNPAGRAVEGSLLLPGQESFVGHAPMPIRHGLTLGEAAQFWKTKFPKVNLTVVKMRNYGFDQPWPSLPWVNPSPNAASLNMARCFAGTVLLEGTDLSEGRGTTVPLEVVGAPSLPLEATLKRTQEIHPKAFEGAWIRPCYFEPTFHKHQGQICTGFQMHTGGPGYSESLYRPYRLMVAFMRALREVWPKFEIFHHKPYEYETDRFPIDVINGGPGVREVVEGKIDFQEWETTVSKDEQVWLQECKSHTLYT